MKRLLILALLAAGCTATTPPTPEPTPEQTRYIIQGASINGGELNFVVTVPCSEKPTSWPLAEAFCNLDDLRVIKLRDRAEWEKYGQGEPYPQPNP